MIQASDLPDGVRQSPVIMDARITSQTRRLDDHETRIRQLEQSPASTVDTPMGKLPLPLVIAALLALIAARPDLVASKLLP